eukprot:TRINITY_DN1698_c0_g1_i1.p1 TRINITY_DN1698_c0_g1~~TRINITY_DN1698_c0_g1_i1.p1  ORF type:complete len:509 (-),score=77.12 TRINITY_DN1698_c0_g1_i1:1351-2715(-)
MFTRGDLSELEQRGESMVEKHHAKLQSEKEHAAMEKLQGLMPQMGTTVKALALQESAWDVDAAVALLRRFQVACADDLAAIYKKRKKRQEEQDQHEEHLQNQRKKSQKTGDETEGGTVSGKVSRGPTTPSESEDQDDSDSRSSEDEREHHSKKNSKHKKRKSHEKDRKRHRSSKKKKRKEKKTKRVKFEKDMELANKNIRVQEVEMEDEGVEFGKYGIIRETDIFSKKSEFTLWALEEKNLDVEALPKFEEKELFREYMEDYNTGTLPHKKYYDLELYERHLLDQRNDPTDQRDEREKKIFNDEEERRREKLMERAIQKQNRLREAYNELKYTDKARDMREQQMLRMQMSLAYRTGDMNKAQKIAERLRPDDLKEQRRTLPILITTVNQVRSLLYSFSLQGLVKFKNVAVFSGVVPRKHSSIEIRSGNVKSKFQTQPTPRQTFQPLSLTRIKAH